MKNVEDFLSEIVFVFFPLIDFNVLSRQLKVTKMVASKREPSLATQLPVFY